MNDHLRLDWDYFEWLRSLVENIPNKNPRTTYSLLCERMFKRRFEDWLPNDDNRSSDGRNLRMEFLDRNGLTAGRDWLSEDCSFLEMLIALSRRVADKTDSLPAKCFWLLVTNLELEKYNDDRFNDGISDAVDFVIDMVNNRTYERDGRGGLFPLKYPQEDQREVEIWYQMSAYLLENFDY